MPTNITYKNNTLTTVTPGQSKILKTSGKYLEDDLTISNSSSNQVKGVTITPTTSSQTQTVTPDSAYEGLSAVTVTVNPIPSSYIIPSGTINIANNTTGIDVTNYSNAVVNVSPSLTTASVTPSETAQNITPGTGYDGLSSVTVNGITNTYVGSSVPRNPSISKGLSYDEETNIISNNIVVQKGYFDNRYATTGTIYPHQFLPTQAETTIIPSETAQTAVDIHKWTTGTVTVAAITPTYVGSGVTTNPTITVSGPTVTVPGGYYNSQQTKTVSIMILPSEPSLSSAGTYKGQATSSKTPNEYQYINIPVGYNTTAQFYEIAPNPVWLDDLTVNNSGTYSAEYYDLDGFENVIVPGGSVSTPSTTITANPTVSVSNSGLITASVTGSSNVAPSVSAGYISSGTAGTISVTGSTTLQLTTQGSTTVTPSTTTQTVNVTGKYMTGNVTVNPIPSSYIIPSGTLTITHAGTTSVTNYANVDVPEVRMFGGINSRYKTENNVRKWEVSSNIIVDPEEGGSAGWADEGVYPGVTLTYSAVPSGITITPTQTTQTIGGTNYMMEGPVTVASVPRGDLKGLLVMPTDIDFSTGHTPTATWTVEPSGMVIYQCYGTGSITNAVYSSGYIENTQQIPAEYEAGDSYQLPTQGATTVIPSETAQTLSVNQKYMTGNVTVAAITSTYVGSGITRNPTITVSGPSVTIPAGYYSSQQTKTVASGSVELGIEATVEALPTITVNSSGLITALNNSSSQVEIIVNPGYVSGNVTDTIGIAGESTRQLPTQGATTITPSSSTQTIAGQKYLTGTITVNPIPSQYIVPSGTYTISSVDSTNTFNVTNYASAKVTITDADNIAY